MLDILNKAKALPYIIVIGSWAEFIYENSKVLDYKASLVTQDVDLLIPNIRKPADKINVSKALQEQGFLMNSTIMSGVGLSKFHKEGLLEVEFLVQELGAGKVEPYDTHLGVTAQGLRNMNILIDNRIEVIYNNYKITVPRPEAYILHKLVINPDRKPEYKKSKDAETVRRLVKKVDETIFNDIFAGLTKKQKHKVLQTCDKFFLKVVIDIIN